MLSGLMTAHLGLVHWLAESTGFVQLVVDHGLVQVIRLNAKALEISFGSALCYCLVVGSDGLQRLLQKRLTCFRHSQQCSLHLGASASLIIRCRVL